MKARFPLFQFFLLCAVAFPEGVWSTGQPAPIPATSRLQVFGATSGASNARCVGCERDRLVARGTGTFNAVVGSSSDQVRLRDSEVR